MQPNAAEQREILVVTGRRLGRPVRRFEPGLPRRQRGHRGALWLPISTLNPPTVGCWRLTFTAGTMSGLGDDAREAAIPRLASRTAPPRSGGHSGTLAQAALLPRELGNTRALGGQFQVMRRTEIESRVLFERLYQDFAAEVLAFCRRRVDTDLADDATAETFLVVWRRLGEVPREPRGWLLGVARLVMANQRRGSRRAPRCAGRASSPGDHECGHRQCPAACAGGAGGLAGTRPGGAPSCCLGRAQLEGGCAGARLHTDGLSRSADSRAPSACSGSERRSARPPGGCPARRGGMKTNSAEAFSLLAQANPVPAAARDDLHVRAEEIRSLLPRLPSRAAGVAAESPGRAGDVPRRHRDRRRRRRVGLGAALRHPRARPSRHARGHHQHRGYDTAPGATSGRPTQPTLSAYG